MALKPIRGRKRSSKQVGDLHDDELASYINIYITMGEPAIYTIDVEHCKFLRRTNIAGTHVSPNDAHTPSEKDAACERSCCRG